MKKVYKIKHKLGTVGDLVTEWMTLEEVEEFNKKHNEYIKELKEKGEYLKEVETDIILEDDPILNSNNKKSSPTESYRFEIINVGELLKANISKKS